MDKINYSRLYLRRQFLLTPEKTETGEWFNPIEISGNTYLYYHTDLNVCRIKKDLAEVILLGDLYDPFSEKSNPEILQDLIDNDFLVFVRRTYVYAGRFILLHIDDHGNLKIVTDPASHRKVFWTVSKNKTWCASEIKTLAGLLGIKPEQPPDVMQFYQSEEFLSKEACGVIDNTLYKSIRQLGCNHYLDYPRGVTIRFWPSGKIRKRSLLGAAMKSKKLLKGYLRNASIRYNLMIPVTAGLDSRILLGASKSIRKEVLYYVFNNLEYPTPKSDIYVPKRLLKRLGLDFQIILIQDSPDEEFSRQYQLNYQYPVKNREAVIYMYLSKFQEYINIPGNFSEVAGNAFFTTEKKITAPGLAHLYGYSHPYVIEIYKQWIKETEPLALKNNLDLLDLFYWEERMATWATYYQTNKDIAQDEFWPFNSRYLISIMLGVKSKQRDKSFGGLHYKIVKLLWKETMALPLNPTFRETAAKVLKYLGLFKVILRFGFLRGKYK